MVEREERARERKGEGGIYEDEHFFTFLVLFGLECDDEDQKGLFLA